MEHYNKTSRQGVGSGSTEFTVVELDNGNEYYFKEASKGLLSGSGLTPTSSGRVDEEGLREACEYLESEGFEIVMSDYTPSGFEY